MLLHLLSSLMFWLPLAVAVFWAVGAYNRLVRLRGQALSAFAALDPALVKQVELAQSNLPDMGLTGQTRPADLGDEADTLWLALRAASHQFSASLSALRPRPLDTRHAAAVAAAWAVLEMCWNRLQNEAHDLAGPALPENLVTQWQHLSSQLMPLREQFNLSVARYNQAIGQFPALLLAWLFQMQSGREI